ncbi:hypothetical protein HD806DRAFT_536663 [Xylariaceae sp. AK1471]|nr:hypothetical protein HD806DRAFT_536663 [Xylariaceae sp. AK1471]
MILFTSADKPMFKASKGTVQHQLTLNLYSRELDDLYKSNEQLISKTLNEPRDSYDDLERSVKDIISTSSDIDVEGLAIYSDLVWGNATVKNTESDMQKIQKMYDLHAADMPLCARPAQEPSDEFTVLLTGSTGSLGSYVHRSLLNEPRVSKIYCLNCGLGSLSLLRTAQTAEGFP